MGKYCDGISLEQGEEAIWQELNSVCENPIAEQELRKMKNKNEASATFSNMKILDKAMNLAYYTHLGESDWINKEREFYNNVSICDLQQAAEQMFRLDYHSVLYYLKNDKNASE